jgi:PD-(D/E)XK nuclease superfamily protein
MDLRKKPPDTSHPVEVGLRSEAAILSELVRRGYHVLTPFGFNHRYDLVIDLDGEFVRAQCKTGRLRGGTIVFATGSTRINAKKAFRRSYEGQIDVFLVYWPATSDIYVVPIEEVPAGTMALRVKPTRNRQSIGVRWAAQYRLPG